MLQITNIQINHLTNPVGISPNHIRLFWNVQNCLWQTAFRVVAQDPSGKVLEDSGKRNSNAMFYRVGTVLPYDTTISFTIECWDEDNIPGQSECIAFHTGIQVSNPDAWEANWINPENYEIDPEKRYPASYLRKTFWLDEEDTGTESYLYITAHGIFDVFLNGKCASEHRFMPGTNQVNKRLMVECLEVSKFLHPGRNEIIVSVGDGWYRGSMGYGQNRNVFGTDLALLAQMTVNGRVVLKTDETWQATQAGPVGLNDFMVGEEYDARKEMALENDTDPVWHEVVLQDHGTANLIPVDTVPMLEQEAFCAEILITPKGETVLDFKQCIVGYVKLDFIGTAGDKLVLTHGEALDGDGNFTIENFQSMYKDKPVKQEVSYICKDGRNQHHPTKTYMGFRYVKVEADFEIKPEYFTAVAVYSDMKTTGFFECGVPEVNQLFSNALWSMKGNFQDVPTDCPTREKSGYSGDAQTYAYTAMYMMDCYPVLAKWIREQAAGQFEDGVIPQVAPSPEGTKRANNDGGIGWSDSIEIVPYQLMRRYNDETILNENYETIKRWIDSQIRRAKKTRLVHKRIVPKELLDYTIDTGWMWGEWLEPGQDYAILYLIKLLMFSDIEVGTAYLYYGCYILAWMAQQLGLPEDPKYYQQYADNAKKAYRHICLKKGKIKERKRQCRYVRPIYMDLLTENEKWEVAETLSGMIRKNGNKLNTGFLSTHELSRVLSNYGQVKTAYDLLLQCEAPSWLYPVINGCTTVPETWFCFDKNGNPKNSFNHYSYGAIAGWLLDSACGIRVDMGEITIAPHPDARLKYAKGTYDSPYGRIVSEWHFDDGHIKYHIEIPSNMTAKICLENRGTVTVEPGQHDFVV